MATTAGTKLALLLLSAAAVAGVGHGLCEYKFLVGTKNTEGAGTSLVSFTIWGEVQDGPVFTTEQGSFYSGSTAVFSLRNRGCLDGCITLDLKVIETAALAPIFSSAAWDCKFVKLIITDQNNRLPQVTRVFEVNRVLPPSTTTFKAIDCDDDVIVAGHADAI